LATALAPQVEASVYAAIEAVRRKAVEAGELALMDLTDKEIRDRLSILRERALPEVLRKRFTRENVDRDWEISVA
jgi:hypothetical protein